ncbi:hypothetical protein [Parendozoicomonas haliclonae]|uniref:Uncharacterized protein n=1 Tax=Parendozoicomonas haliclonae TaxID=1960125 RepID=A0A1X7AKB2_9GAMM|nr:hypothetical protein [Parendozoicomonas haliclonae]SMA47012.1 hypothetical protein EHSB41UT_02279 [Parendozoicomonas haliclonae]
MNKKYLYLLASTLINMLLALVLAFAVFIAPMIGVVWFLIAFNKKKSAATREEIESISVNQSLALGFIIGPILTVALYISIFVIN